MRQELSRGLSTILFGVSVFAACTVIHKVSRAIAKQKGQFLSFPENLADTIRNFYDVARFSLFSLFVFSLFTSLFTIYDVVHFL